MPAGPRGYGAPEPRPGREVSFVEELAAALPDGAVVTDPDVLEGYRYDRTTWLTPGHPIALAFPTTTAQVAAAVGVAAGTTSRSSHGAPAAACAAGPRRSTVPSPSASSGWTASSRSIPSTSSRGWNRGS
jgi:glycolate oxidase